MLMTKLFTISSLLVSTGLAVPLSPAVNAVEIKREDLGAREYWGGNPGKRDEALDAREYWGGNPGKRGEDLVARESCGLYKRGKLDPNCIQTARGIFCTYSDEEVDAYNKGKGIKDEVLEPYCFKTLEGTACAYHINQK